MYPAKIHRSSCSSRDFLQIPNCAPQSIEPCEVDINGNLKDYGYTLEVQYVALTWMDLVNFFEFDWMLYMVLFMAVG